MACGMRVAPKDEPVGRIGQCKREGEGRQSSLKIIMAAYLTVICPASLPSPSRLLAHSVRLTVIASL